MKMHFLEKAGLLKADFEKFLFCRWGDMTGDSTTSSQRPLTYQVRRKGIKFWKTIPKV
jgi:hypothetical protein